MNFGTSWLTRMRIAPILLLTGQRQSTAKHAVNMTLLGKARSEHDVLWTGTWYGFDQSANRKIRNFDTNYRVGQKKYDSLIYYNVKSKRAITLK
jgi:hypothetical protein